MTTDLKDVLMELNNKITEVYDLELAEEMTDIYIDLSGRVSELSSQYWKLVKTLAKTEKERDDLARELDVTKKRCETVFEIGVDIVQKERKIQNKLDIEKDQIEYDRDYYKNEVYRLRAQNEVLTESHKKCVEYIKKLL